MASGSRVNAVQTPAAGFQYVVSISLIGVGSITLENRGILDLGLSESQQPPLSASWPILEAM